MDKTLQDTIKSLLSDIEAMRCEPPYDIKEDGDADMKAHWFGGFSECQIDDEDSDAIIQWPNLGILAEKLQHLLIDQAMQS